MSSFCIRNSKKSEAKIDQV